MQSVGDHEHRPVADEAAQRLLHKVFRFRIGERRRLVQDQDRSVGEQGPGDGEALTFAARKLDVGAEHRVIPVGQSHDPVVDLRIRRRGLDLAGTGFRPGQCDVVADSASDELDVLKHETDLGVQLVGCQCPHIATVDPDRAAVDVVEPRKQRRQRRLAGTGGTDQCGDGPGPQGQADVMDDRNPWAVTEADVLEGHRAGRDQRRHLGGV